MPDLSPSPALVRFAERQSRVGREVERRSEPRHFLAEPVVVQPVNSDLRRVADPTAAVTRDISTSGIGLIFEEQFEHELAAIELCTDGETVFLLVEVVWHRPMEPFLYLGSRILRELDEMPS